MLAIAVPGPLFFLLVLTMPLTKSGGGAVRTAAVDEHAPRDFLPYARANRATLLCVFGSIFAMAVAMNSGMMWFRLALPRAVGPNQKNVGVRLGTAVHCVPPMRG